MSPEELENLPQSKIDELEQIIVTLHNMDLVDIYSLRSKWDPAGYLRNQRKQKITKQTRWKVYRRDGFRCVYCFSDSAILTLDHIVPECQGGSCTPDNLVTSCGKCNNQKGTTSTQEFVKTKWLKNKQRANHRHLSTIQKAQLIANLESIVIQSQQQMLERIGKSV